MNKKDFFSNEDKIITQNDYEEKRWSAYKNLEKPSFKKWGKFQEIGLTDKRHGSGRLRTVSKEEKMDLIEELVYSHEEQSHTLLAPK